MQLPILLTSDLHLASGESVSYRFKFFDWLEEQVRIEKVRTLCILGDLTDAKDNHSAELVNRIVGVFRRLHREHPLLKVWVLSGNHDWLVRSQEFFRFLEVIPNLRFITTPTEDDDVKGPVSAFFLPYSKQPVQDWAGLDLSHYDYVFMHQTIAGAIASNGQKMDGEALPDLSAPGKIYSGDIHVPQVIGPLEYVGSPYHVHFGDRFGARCVLIEKDRTPVNLYYKDYPLRVTMTVERRLTPLQIDEMCLRPGDQVKLRIQLHERDKHDWQRIRRDALAELKAVGAIVAGVELIIEKAEGRIHEQKLRKGIDPDQALYDFVQREEWGPDAWDAAQEIIQA